MAVLVMGGGLLQLPVLEENNKQMRWQMRWQAVVPSLGVEGLQ